MHILFIFVLIYSPISNVICSSLPSNELRIKYAGEALNSLSRLLTFFESDINDLNLDGVYGLRIAQGQLNALQETIASTSDKHNHLTDENNFIQSLSQQIERIANKTLTILAKKEPLYLQRFNLVASKPFRTEYETRYINKNLVENGERNGRFDEDKSDYCFGELLGSNNDSKETMCLISESCWKMMTSPMSKDYLVTHQLLWFLVAKNIGCLDNRRISHVANKNLKSLEDRYCANIYQDAESNIQNNENQDLFLEELLLCSIIGYEEFLRIDWYHLVLSWQHAEYGCFTSASEIDAGNLRIRRHLLVEQDMNNGCLSHKSGLAAGLLATYSRVFLQ